MPGAPWGGNQCMATPEVRSAAKNRYAVEAADSWASITAGQVHQAGARNLWDEAVAASLTVTRERQWVWLDDPANTVTTLA